MSFLEGEATMTGVQKVLISLFVITIALSCLTLVWFMVEKPDLKRTHCEQMGRTTSFVTSSYSYSNNTHSIDNLLQRNCTSTQNPPMSGGLEAMINLTTLCGFLFLSTAICAYVFRKKLVKEPVAETEKEEQKP